MSNALPNFSLPKKVKIGPLTYKIKDWDPKEATDHDRFGDCSKARQVIHVDTSYGRQRTALTLLHEILHAIYYQQRIQAGVSEEQIVDSFSTGLLTVWTDNPEVFGYIAFQLECAKAEDEEEDNNE